MNNKSSLSERTVENYLVARVEESGGIAEKTTSPGRRGYFDRVIVLPGGHVIFCEVKKPSGSHTAAHQKARHERYKSLGATVTIVKTLADVDRLIDVWASQDVHKEAPEPPQK